MLAFQAGQIVLGKRGGHCLGICHPAFVSPVIFVFLFCIMLFVLRKICRLVSLGELTQALLRVCCNWSSQRLHFRHKSQSNSTDRAVDPCCISIVWNVMRCGTESPSQIILLKAHQKPDYQRPKLL